uniref:TANK-binding kinase 1-binding protein 1-like n=1 Tax=Callorhinchus milii TaxID=7868 RepID=A0A4W3GTG6_CALMI
LTTVTTASDLTIPVPGIGKEQRWGQGGGERGLGSGGVVTVMDAVCDGLHVVSLALAYTELSEELGRLQSLTEAQTEILSRLSEEQAPNHGNQHSVCVCVYVCHCLGTTSRWERRCTSEQDRAIQPLEPASKRDWIQSPPQRFPIPPLNRSHPVCRRRAEYASFPRDAGHRLRASFQGQRSYSEIGDCSGYHRVSALGDSDALYSAAQYLKVPGDEDGEREEAGTPQTEYEKHSSEEEEEEWMAHSPPGTLSRAIRPTASCVALPIPHHPLHRNNVSYSGSEHAQSWPSINLWMETVDSETRSCPLCQLAFPLSYPDDALIKHIDTHLENSKI